MATDNAIDEKSTKGGPLMKRGEINKNWKMRWFQVRDGKLYYYKRKQDQKFIGIILLEQSVIRECREELGAEFAFEVVTKTRIYYLSAASKIEQKEWMHILSLHTLLHKENELFIQIEEDIERTIFAQSLEEEKQMYPLGLRTSRIFIKNNFLTQNSSESPTEKTRSWNRVNIIGNRNSKMIGKKNGSTGSVTLPANMSEIGARLRSSIFASQLSSDASYDPSSLSNNRNVSLPDARSHFASHSGDNLLLSLNINNDDLDLIPNPSLNNDDNIMDFEMDDVIDSPKNSNNNNNNIHK